jgi:leucyl aminopeptidase (aminopeptidase T)
LSSCSTWDKLTRIEVQTIEVQRNIPIQNRPARLELNNIKWFVVTDQNFEEFKEKFIKQNDEFLFFAISVRDYETLALNMADIKRYVVQQKQIIIYYEKALSPKEEEKEK